MRAAILALLVGCTTGEWVRDYDGHIPRTNLWGTYAAMVLDATTKKPLPGATLRLYGEDVEPEALPGRFVVEAVADEYGVVSLPWRDEYRSCHFVFDHPGYGAVDELGGGEDEVELYPGREYHGVLLDALGEPAPGVEVEYYVGCPHSPAVRRATTDGEGRFVIRDASGQHMETLWAPMAGGEAVQFSPLPEPRPGWILEPLRPPPGVVVTGTVFDAEGRPAAGAVVYSTQFPRGPKTVAAEDGGFRLVGVGPEAEIRFGPPGVRADMQRTEPPKVVEPEPEKENVIHVYPPGDEGEYVCRLGWTDVFEPELDDYIEVRTRLRGPVRIDFEHEVYGEGSLVVNVDGPLVEVRPEDFPRPGLVTVLDADGRPAGPVSLQFPEDTLWWGPELHLVGNVFASWDFQPGKRVRISGEDHAPVYRVLEGESPWVLRLGGATIDLRVAQGRPLCWIDGGCFGWFRDWTKRELEEDVPAEGRRLVIPGLDPGPHTLLVGAAGRRGKVLRVVLAEGETRVVELELQPVRQ